MERLLLLRWKLLAAGAAVTDMTGGTEAGRLRFCPSLLTGRRAKILRPDEKDYRFPRVLL